MHPGLAMPDSVHCRRITENHLSLALLGQKSKQRNTSNSPASGGARRCVQPLLLWFCLRFSVVSRL
jgi:hypothetical protein